MNHILSRRLLGVIFLTLIPFGGRAVDSLSEPDTVIYGQVFNSETNPAHIMPEGTVEWTIQSAADASRIYTFETQIERLGDGNYYFSFRITHQAGLTGLDVDSSNVPLNFSGEQFNHTEIKVNGVAATVRPPAEDHLIFDQHSRGVVHRIDLDVNAPSPDSDGDGMPDWWERQNGTDPDFPDADGDADGDGIPNGQEFLNGTDPNRDDGVPRLLRSTITGTEGGLTGFRIAAADLNSTDEQVTFTLSGDIEGGELGLLEDDGSFSPLGSGDAMTLASIKANRVLFRHTDPTFNPVRVPLSLNDEDPGHTAQDIVAVIDLKRPTRTDGSDAALWLDAGHVAEALFSDTFNRADGAVGNNDNGLGGSQGVSYAQTAAVTPGDPAGVSDDRLVLTGKPGASASVSPEHNFIDSSISGAGGFAVSFKVVAPAGDANHAAISLGHSAATRNLHDSARNPQAAWSLFLRENGRFTTHDGDTALSTDVVWNTNPLAGQEYVVEIVARTDDFNAGSDVVLTASIDGIPVPLGGGDVFSQTVTWNSASENYLVLEAFGAGAKFDDWRVTSLPRKGAVDLTHWSDRSGHIAGPDSRSGQITRQAPANGKQSMVFDSVTEGFLFPADSTSRLFGEEDRTLFTVFRANGPGRQQVLSAPDFEIAVGGDDGSPVADRGLFEFGDDQYITGEGVRASSGFVSLTAERKGGSTMFFRNGLPDFERTPADIVRAAAGTEAAIGARWDGGSLSQSLEGEIGEILLFRKNLDGHAKRAVEFYLKSKWQDMVVFDAFGEPDHQPQAITAFTPSSGPALPHILIGGRGADILVGGPEDDWIKGYLGDDLLTGGGGSNVFVFDDPDFGHDTITDFDVNEDRLDIGVFTGDTRNLARYIRSTMDGPNTVLGLDFDGDGSGYTDATITLLNTHVVIEQLDDTEPVTIRDTIQGTESGLASFRILASDIKIVDDARIEATPEEIAFRLTGEIAGGQLFEITAGGALGQLGIDETFTQAEVNAGKILFRHTDPSVNPVVVPLEILDINGFVVPMPVTVELFLPSLTDGSDASLWLDGRFLPPGQSGDLQVTHWTDRSGNDAGPDSFGGGNIQRIGASGTLALDGVTQAFGFSESRTGTLFPDGDRTVFVVFDANGPNRQQILTTPYFELAVAGDDGSSLRNRVLFEVGSDRFFTLRRGRDTGGLSTVAAFSSSGGHGMTLGGLPFFERAPDPIPPLPQNTVSAFLGARFAGGALNQQMSGDLAEVLVYGSALSQVRRRNIDFYLKSKWDGFVLFDASAETEGQVYAACPEGGMPHILVGGEGPDILTGGPAGDWIKGSRSDDILIGGGGPDAFLFDDALAGNDTIVDFHPDEDILDFGGMLSGDTRDLRRFVDSFRDGKDTVLGFDLDGDGSGYTDVTIRLQNIDFDVEGLTDTEPVAKRRELTVTEAGQATFRIDATDSRIVNGMPVRSAGDDLTYQLEAPVRGGELLVLASDGGENPVTVGGTFTQGDVDRGQVVFRHLDPSRRRIPVSLELKDANGFRIPFPAVVHVKRPAGTDGSDATFWLDANHVVTPLLSDRFDRPDQADDPGQNDNAFGGAITQAYTHRGGGIAANRLVLSGAASPAHNFIDQGIRDTGGFKASFKMILPGTDANYAGFSLGHTEASRRVENPGEAGAQAWGVRFRKSGTLTTVTGDGGTVTESSKPVIFADGVQTGQEFHVELFVHCTSFGAGQSAGISLFVDGRPVPIGDGGEFEQRVTWNQADANYLVWQGAGGAATLDDLQIATLGVSGEPALRFWPDRSGRGKGPAVVADAVVRSDQPGEKRSLVFDGPDKAFAFDSAETGLFFPSGNRTMITVFRAGGGARQQLIGAPAFELAVHGADGSEQEERLLYEAGNQKFYSTNPVLGSPSFSAASVIDEDGVTRIGVDGVALFGSMKEPHSRFALDELATIGARLNNGLLEQHLEGQIAEILSFDRVLDSGRMRELSFYVKSKWKDHIIFDASTETGGQSFAVFVPAGGMARPHILIGGDGSDQLVGGPEADCIRGGPGDDRLRGGEGGDHFIIDRTTDGHDTIEDFDVDEDILDFNDVLLGRDSNLRSFVNLTVRGDDTLVGIDTDGDGSGYTDISVRLEGVRLTNANLGDLVDGGVFAAGEKTPSLTILPPSVTTAPAADFSGEFENPMSGSYRGLIRIPDSRGEDFPVGLIKLDLTKGRNFSGKVRFFGNELPIRGTFDVSGEFISVIEYRNYLPVNFVDGRIDTGVTPVLHQLFELKLSVGRTDDGTHRIEGTIDDLSGRVYHLSAHEGYFNSGKRAFVHQGGYTFVILRDANAPRPEFPRGNGCGTIRISTRGEAMITGFLGDGEKFTSHSFISRDHRLPVYRWLFDGAARVIPSNFLAGEMILRDVPSSDLDGSLTWVKVPHPNGKGIYPDGFQLRNLAFIGARYHRPPRGHRAIEGFADTDRNAVARFEDGKPEGGQVPAERPPADDYEVTWDQANRITYEPAGTEKMRLLLKDDGMVGGAFDDRGLALKMRGVVLQKQNIVSGQFLARTGPAETGLFTLASKQTPPPQLLDDPDGAPLTAAPAGDVQLTATPLQTDAQGRYSGVALRDPQGAQGDESPLLFQLRVSATGAFTGAIQIRNSRVKIRGQFDGNGSFTGPFSFVERKNGLRVTGMIEVSLQLSTTPAGNLAVGGTVTDSGDSSVYRVSLVTPGFDRTNPATAHAGRYTFAMTQDGTSTSPGAEFPRGTSVGLMIVDDRGGVRFLGNLADGTKVSHQGTLSRDGRFTLALLLYRTAPRGFLQGDIVFRDLPGISDADGAVQWVKRADDNEKRFRAGFNREVILVANRYVRPAGGTRVLSALTDRIRNTAIHLSEGGTDPEIPLLLATWDERNRVRYPVVGGEKLAIVVTAKNGRIKGTYRDAVVDPDSGEQVRRTLIFHAVVLQKQQSAAGYFLNDIESGNVMIVPVESVEQ